MERQVVITGMGTINSLGLDVDSTWEALKSGKLGISAIKQQLTESTGVKFGGVINNYQGDNYFDRKQLRRLDFVQQLGIIAAREAASDANLDEIADRERIGVNVTSGMAGLNTIEENILKAAEKGFGKVSPMFIPNAIVNLVAGNVAIDLNCQGICTPVVTACASSTDGIGQGAMYIREGLVDVMVTGGSETALTNSGLAGFENMGALSKGTTAETASTPFDKDRSGFVMGEGAACLILEEYEHAKKRGAKIYGFVSGYGATCDANHITAPDSEARQGIRAAKMAIEKAGIKPQQIGYVNAHGTSTPLNDKGENLLLNNIYGEDVKDVAVTSTKSMTGHLLGATGAFEAIATIKSINEGIATPTIGINELDPTFTINVVENNARPINTEYGMSFSLGFGGHNAVIILKKGEL